MHNPKIYAIINQKGGKPVKKLKLSITALIIAVLCIPVISGCRKDQGTYYIEFNLPDTLPAHIEEVLLECNHAIRDDGTIYNYSYDNIYPQNVKLRITCERGYMPSVRFTMKTKSGEVIRTVTEKDITYYDFADYDETGVPKKETVYYRFESFMTESPNSDLVLTIDKLEVKPAEHTVTFEEINWSGNPYDHFDGELTVSFSGAIPTKLNGQTVISSGHKYKVRELQNLFKGEPWLTHYGDEFSMTVHFSEREVPPDDEHPGYDFVPLFYTYEMRDGQRWGNIPVSLIKTTATSTTLTAIFKIDWDYSIDLIVEPLYRLCPIPEA